MKTTRILATIGMLAMLSPLHAGQTFTYPAAEPIFEITYPAGWEVEQDSDTLTAGPSSGGLSSVLMAIAGDDLNSALEGAEQGLNETFGEYQLSDPSEGQINGLPVVFFNGKGQTPDGVSLDLGCAIFTPNGETFFMLFIFSTGDLGDEETAEMNAILQSIKTK